MPSAIAHADPPAPTLTAETVRGSPGAVRSSTNPVASPPTRGAPHRSGLSRGRQSAAHTAFGKAPVDTAPGTLRDDTEVPSPSRPPPVPQQKAAPDATAQLEPAPALDRKSTRLNSSHV